MTNRVGIFVGLAVWLLVLSAGAYAAPAYAEDTEAAGGTGTTLYEISERVTFDPMSVDGHFVIFRNATSPLLGFAEHGTPLCPSTLLITVPKLKRCTIIATGTDHVSTRTGTGPVHGKFDVVVNAPGNSSVHVPNLPVISGTFDGTVDLSQAVFFGVPLGSIEGTFTITQGADANGTLWDVPPVTLPFTGRFRLPFALGHRGERERAEGGHAAFYLADDLTSKIPIKSSERSVGFPTVRLELSFGP